MEIRAHARLAAPAWICATWDQAEVSRLHRGAGRICRHTNVVNRPRVNHGRGGSHIQENIVVGRIIRDAITAADDRLVFPDQLLEDAWGPGKAHIWPVIVKVFRNVRDFRHIGWRACRPEAISHILNADIVQ